MEKNVKYKQHSERTGRWSLPVRLDKFFNNLHRMEDPFDNKNKTDLIIHQACFVGFMFEIKGISINKAEKVWATIESHRQNWFGIKKEIKYQAFNHRIQMCLDV